MVPTLQLLLKEFKMIRRCTTRRLLVAHKKTQSLTLMPPDCNAAKVDPDLDLKSRWLKRRYGVLYGNSQKSKKSDVSMRVEKCTNLCCQAFCCKFPYENPTIAPSESRALGFKSVVDTVCSDVFTASPVGSIVREYVIYSKSR